MTDPRRRTLVSFALLAAFLTAFSFGWYYISSPISAETDDVPPTVRKVLDLNGKIWKKMFRKDHVVTCKPPPPGTPPRVNGDIGLEKPLNLETWRLHASSGSTSVTLTMKDLMALPRSDSSTHFICIEGWSEDISYAGVKFTDFMKAYNLSPMKYVGLVTEDGEYYVSIDIESMEHPQTMLAWEMNGMPLSPENGAPLRLIIPVKYGIKHIKRIGRIFFSDERPPDYWAEQGYDWYAGL